MISTTSAKGPFVRRLNLSTPIRDVSITYVARDQAYYLTGTTGKPDWWLNNSGIEMWRATSLMGRWTPVGMRYSRGRRHVWTFETDCTWHCRWGSAALLWAPEIHFARGTFFLTYSITASESNGRGMRVLNHTLGGLGLLRSVSGKAEGPYVDVKPTGPLAEGRDASLLVDADGDGAMYLLFHDARIAMLRADLTDLIETPQLLLTGAGERSLGYEGASAFQAWNRTFIFVARYETLPDGSRVYSCHAASSKGGVRGPYGPSYRVYEHCGHNVVFRDSKGGVWSTMFGDDGTAPWRESAGVFRMQLGPRNRLMPTPPSTAEQHYSYHASRSRGAVRG